MPLIIGLVLSFLLIGSCSKSSDGDPAPDVIPQYPDMKQYFDAGYVAPVGFEDIGKATTVVDGKPVRVIKDIIGDKDLTWAGKDVPSPMWPTPPVYHLEGATGYILVHNVSDTFWESVPFTAIAQPYDLYVVLRDVEAVNYEGYFARSLGLRNRGDRLELSISGPNTPSTTSVDMNTPTILEFNKISIVRIRFDGANTKLYINNVVVAPGAVNIGAGKINQLVYGTNSHAAQHDFFGMWVKFGTISDSDHSKIYQALADFYKPGIFPAEPLANNIKAVWNNTTKAWEAQYTYEGGTNLEDITKTTYQWGYWTQGIDLDTSDIIVGATSKTLIRSSYPAIFPEPGQGKVKVFVRVTVFGKDGKSWNHLVRSAFTLDNVL